MLIFLSAFFVFWLIVVIAAERLFLWPTTQAIDAHGAQPRIIDGIEVWIARSPGARTQTPRAYVLRFYGNADRVENWITEDAALWGNHPVEVWGVNYPGFGRSTGKASLAGVARAAETAARTMFAEANGQPVFVFGTSIGTTAALHVIAHFPVAFAFLHNPPALPQMVRGEFGWWNLWLLAAPVSWRIPSEVDSVRNAAKARAPALFVHSEKDEVAPLRYQRLVADAYAGPKDIVLMKGRQHNDPIDTEAQTALAKAIDEVWQRL